MFTSRSLIAMANRAIPGFNGMETQPIWSEIRRDFRLLRCATRRHTHHNSVMCCVNSGQCTHTEHLIFFVLFRSAQTDHLPGSVLARRWCVALLLLRTLNQWIYRIETEQCKRTHDHPKITPSAYTLCEAFASASSKVRALDFWLVTNAFALYGNLATILE